MLTRILPSNFAMSLITWEREWRRRKFARIRWSAWNKWTDGESCSVLITCMCKYRALSNNLMSERSCVVCTAYIPFACVRACVCMNVICVYLFAHSHDPFLLFFFNHFCSLWFYYQFSAVKWMFCEFLSSNTSHQTNRAFPVNFDFLNWIIKNRIQSIYSSLACVCKHSKCSISLFLVTSYSLVINIYSILYKITSI